ncbi:MAG TPA: MerC domain-containing protein [Blastocatellia bacterium]|nr:MerC domain-containing protein [Blastocatellia bacterium]
MWSSTTNNRLDRAGVAASLICGLHCALAPALLACLPFAQFNFLADERTEWVFIAASLAIAALSLLPSYTRLHRHPLPLISFVLGGLAILAVRLLSQEETRFELPVVVSGAVLIAVAHFINYRLCRTCADCRSLPQMPLTRAK